MATRRAFLQSVAASALPFSIVSRVAADWNTRPPESAEPLWPLYRFIVDDRFAESLDAGRIAAQRGATLHVMNGGDITPFWFHDLSLRWRETPAVVAGVTAHGPLFVLEQFAWDHGMQVITRNDYGRTERSHDDEQLLSWLIGPGNGRSRVPAR